MSGMTWSTLCSFIGAPVGLPYLLYVILSHKPRKELKGKVVLITGASSGLGEACAKEFYKAGCRLILTGRKLDQLKRVKDQLIQQKLPNMDTYYVPELLTFDLEDLTSLPGKIDEAVQLFGCVDILINNAGISFHGKVEDSCLDVVVKVMTVNFFGQVAITKAVLPHMLKKGEGSIVGISSVQGKMAIPDRSAYGASKHACQAFYDSLRAEVADKNIDISVISPSYIQTNISWNALCADGSQYNALDKTIATGMKPEYVAQRIMGAVISHEKDVTIGPVTHKLAILLRALVPSLYFKIMAIRAKSEEKTVS